LGGGTKRIARELGASPRDREALPGVEDWLCERLRRHRGNADVVRQELISEKGIVVGLRTVERQTGGDGQQMHITNRKKMGGVDPMGFLCDVRDMRLVQLVSRITFS